ncbi:MAG: 16S rRNA (guanine(966)-N(2))-methyltransferase RsmD [Myxococcota bacterium]
MSIRVIAGRLKRRELKTPRGMATRPTGARVREAVFSILGDVSDLDVLDLYAGSGALGIEALSRGAAHATFVENERHAIACIRDNIALLGLGAQSDLLVLPVERAPRVLATNTRRYALVFCDPPWSRVNEASAALAQFASLLTPAARVVLEHPAQDSPSIVGFTREDERAWGDTGISIYYASTDRSADTAR